MLKKLSCSISCIPINLGNQQDEKKSIIHYCSPWKYLYTAIVKLHINHRIYSFQVPGMYTSYFLDRCWTRPKNYHSHFHSCWFPLKRKLVMPSGKGKTAYVTKPGTFIKLISKTWFVTNHHAAEHDQKQSQPLNTCVDYENHQEKVY